MQSAMKRLQEQLLALAPRWGVGRGVGGEGAGCGPPPSSLQLEQLPEAQASKMTFVIYSTQLLHRNHSSVWGEEASRT